MKLSTSVDEQGVTLVEVQGEVDAHTSGDLDKALASLVAIAYCPVTWNVARNRANRASKSCVAALR